MTTREFRCGRCKRWLSNVAADCEFVEAVCHSCGRRTTETLLPDGDLAIAVVDKRRR